MHARHSTAVRQPSFLPMSRAEMDALGWPELDVLLVSGDAYVDHPAFGTALLGRWLVFHGFRVGIVAQPDWQTTGDVTRMGRPRLFAGVSAGALDSMLAHYTAFRKKRHDDAYTPGGLCGKRPNRACIVYSGLVRQAFPGLPVVIGGVEASMRRATHYDFWTDKIRRSILLDSKASVLVYGMAERSLLELAIRLREIGKQAPVLDTEETRKAMSGVPGTVMSCAPGADLPAGEPPVIFPPHEDILQDGDNLMKSALLMEQHVHSAGRFAVQACGDRQLVFAPPAQPMTTPELDSVYALPFTRSAHPSYSRPIPAVEMVQFSVTTHRGCGGGCSFCSLAIHQGRRIASRSESSLVSEVTSMSKMKSWKGSLSDLGGPSANMWGATCARASGACTRPSCLFPHICVNFHARQQDLADLLRRIARLPGVKHVRTASGVRHDLALADTAYARALAGEFTGGQLKLAPEHSSALVLKLMRKPPFRLFEQFIDCFSAWSRDAGKEQYVVPYLVSAFPGCTDKDMRDLAAWLKARNWTPQQVQCFVPTPGTVATAMYFTGKDPDGNRIHVARTDAERLRQHGMLVGSK